MSDEPLAMQNILVHTEMQWRIQNFEKGDSDSATPTLATPFFYNAESAEFLGIELASLVNKLKGGFNGNLACWIRHWNG